MNFDNTIVTRSKNKRKILYELNEDGELVDISKGVSLNIKKKPKKIIDDESDSDYVSSEEDENSLSEDEILSEDELVPMEEAWKDSLDIIDDNTIIEEEDNDTIRLIKDSLRDVVMDRVMRRVEKKMEKNMKMMKKKKKRKKKIIH